MYTDGGKSTTLQEFGSWLRDQAQDLRLGKRSRAVLMSLADDPRGAAMSTISEIASANGVSASTVTRIATRLGFDGFNDLQNEFRRLLARPSTGPSSRAVAAVVQDGEAVPRHLMQEVLEAELDNVTAGFETLSLDELTAAAKMLTDARRVRVLGLRQCYSLAHFLSYALHLLRDGVAPLGSAGHSLFENIPDLTDSDVVVAISFKPYTREVIEVCAAAKQAGAKVIMISDSHKAPLPYDQGFVMRTSGPLFLSGMAASLVLIEALLVVTAQAIGPQAIARLQKMEALFDTMNVET